MYLCNEFGLIFKYGLNIGSYLFGAYVSCISLINMFYFWQKNVQVDEFYSQIYLFNLGSHDSIFCEKY